MLTSIEIRNFRGLAALDVDLSVATVLVGPNSCGKTTALHAIQLACTALDFAIGSRKITLQSNGWITLCRDKPLRDDQSFLPTNRWYELFWSAKPTSNIQFHLHFSSDCAISQLNIKLHTVQFDTLLMDVEIRIANEHPLLAAEELDDGAAFLCSLRSHLPRAVLIPAFYGVIREEEYRARAALDALLQSGQQAQVVRNLIIRLSTLDGINGFLQQVGVQTRIESCTAEREIDLWRYLRVLFCDHYGSFELACAGTGLASLLALYSAIHLYQETRSNNGPMIFMFDEPEAHLHPRLQGDVAARLVELVTASGGQFLCATHSVEMINRVGRDSLATVLRIDRQQGQIARVLRTEDDLMDELRVWCDLSPFTKLNMMATRRVIFYEGPSDENILNGCARFYLSGDLLRIKRFHEFTRIPLSGTGSLGAKDVLKKALLPLFKPLPHGERIRVVRLLDRDYVRNPQQLHEFDPDSHYEELDVVWSCHSMESLFLNPDCLTDWLELAIGKLAESVSFDRAALFNLVCRAVRAADDDLGLNQAAVEQLAPRLVDGRTNKDIARAIRIAHERVRTAPGDYQQGHSRNRFILNYVRQELLNDPKTRGIANRVRRDIAQVIVASPYRAGLELPATLIPQEIRQVLDYMSTG